MAQRNFFNTMFPALAMVTAMFVPAQPALAQDKPPGATTGKPKGKPVILRVGPGFNIDDANLTAAALNSKGCPTTVTTERGLPKRVTVVIDGTDRAPSFKESGPAGAYGLGCLDK